MEAEIKNFLYLNIFFPWGKKKSWLRLTNKQNSDIAKLLYKFERKWSRWGCRKLNCG